MHFKAIVKHWHRTKVLLGKWGKAGFPLCFSNVLLSHTVAISIIVTNDTVWLLLENTTFWHKKSIQMWCYPVIPFQFYKWNRNIKIVLMLEIYPIIACVRWGLFSYVVDLSECELKDNSLL